MSSAIDRLATLGKDIDAFFAENDIEEGAIRVESVDSAPIPEVSFYLSSRGRSASELLKSIQSFAEKQVKSVTGQSATSENVKLSVSESNAPVVEMKLFEGLTITAKGEGERTIKLGLVGPMLGVSQSLVDGDAKYFLGLPSLRGLMGESQAIWDVYAYVNMNGVIDSLQTYIPWFLMGQTGAPEDGIHAGDVSEVMALLRSHMLGVQSSYKVRDGLYCFDSYWAILD